MIKVIESSAPYCSVFTLWSHCLQLTSGKCSTAEENGNAEVRFPALVPHREEVANARKKGTLEETQDEASGNQSGELDTYPQSLVNVLSHSIPLSHFLRRPYKS